MILTVDVRATVVLGMLKNVEKRTAYAIVNALNDTAKAVQVAERANVARSFHVRKTAFIMRQAAIIKPFASVTRAPFSVTIAVGQTGRLLLSQFEEGGTQRPTPGHSKVPIPILGGARPSELESVPQQYYLSRFQFGQGKRRSGTLKGRANTYLVPGVGVFQRRGTQSILLYSFKPTVHIGRRLHFRSVADTLARVEFPKQLSGQIRQTLLYAWSH